MDNGYTFPVDAVYLWVDDQDPEWQRRRQETLARHAAAQGTEVPPAALAAARFRDNSELKYSLRSLELYAPWINRVHLITDRQCPPWLNRETVHLVDHAEILPPNTARPLFNCNPLELCMHRVPGLSEHFLAFNDDFMFGAPVRQQDFFLPDGSPKVWLDVKRRKQAALLGELSLRRAFELKTRKAIEERFGVFLPHKVKHYPRAYRKSDAEAVWQMFQEGVDRTLQSPFYSGEDMMTTLLYALFLIASKRGVAVPVNGLHQIVHFVQGRVRHIGASLGDVNCAAKMKRIRLLKPLTFCINDSEKAGESERTSLREFLREMFPTPSRFELPETLAPRTE